MNKKRLHLIDIVRLLSFIPIVQYHAISQVYTDTYAEPYNVSLHQGTLFDFIVEICKPFSFSGFSIVILSFFLFGRQNLSTEKTRRLGVLLGAGTLFLLFTGFGGFFSGIFWEWDIYEFLIVSIASVLVAQRYPKVLKALGVFGFFLTWIPFFLLAENESVPLVVRSILFGVCDNEGRGGWALLPWIGLTWFCFYLGSLSKSSLQPELKKGFLKNEIFFWLPALFGSLFYWGAFYSVPLNQNFYCFVFRQEPIVWWSHLLWIFFFIRLSLIESLNEKLHGFVFVRWLSGLKLSTHFGLCYLTQLLYLFIGSFFSDDFTAHPVVYTVFTLSILPVTEVAARLFVRAASWGHPRQELEGEKA
ncbi:hypothetical protein [uncultured Bdellovibrio sp.]|uniref:hypothetical protein n=1 Tax=Bdellovibrio sp. HCB-162 TaxID=3394234 RepID=UPI0025DDF2A0|nr:hypothetical protein [uncultured Bdellovibrio sp.]